MDVSMGFSISLANFSSDNSNSILEFRRWLYQNNVRRRTWVYRQLMSKKNSCWVIVWLFKIKVTLSEDWWRPTAVPATDAERKVRLGYIFLLYSNWMMNKMDVTNQSKRRPKHSFFKFAIGKTRWKMMVMRVRDMDSHNVTRTLPTSEPPIWRSPQTWSTTTRVFS